MTARVTPLPSAGQINAVRCSIHGDSPASCPKCTAEHAIDHAYQGRRPDQVAGPQVIVAYLLFMGVGMLFGVGLTLTAKAVLP